VRNGRPDGRSAAVDVFWGDTLRGRVTLPAGAWRRIVLAVSPQDNAVFRLRVIQPFRPASRRDPRLLGIQIGADPALTPDAR
jgi:hypothetical protein